MRSGSQVRLRAFTSADLPQYVEWRNDPDIKKLLIGWSFPTSVEAEQVWFQQSQQDQSKRRFAIETIEDRKYIGFTSLQDIDWKNRSVEWSGILLGDRSVWSKGYGADAGFALLEFVFREMNMHRVYGYVIADNGHMLRMVERLGFKVDGRLRESLFREGRYKDVLPISLLESEFEQQAELRGQS